MATINIFGASGHGRVILDIVRASGHTPGCFYDDAPRCEQLDGVPVAAASPGNVCGPLVVAVGSNSARRAIASRYAGAGFATIVHPSAIVSPSASLGQGTVVMQGAIVQAAVRTGEHCIINTSASVDHECRLGDYVHISPHATLCGNVKVGDGSWIGAAAVVIPGITIGRGCTIGAGSVVVRDIPDGATAYGNPCRVVKIN